MPGSNDESFTRKSSDVVKYLQMNGPPDFVALNLLYLGADGLKQHCRDLELFVYSQADPTLSFRNEFRISYCSSLSSGLVYTDKADDRSVMADEMETHGIENKLMQSRRE